MSHLGQRLSALIDGELSPAERDRVLTHLARCDACRREAVALRALKQRMHSLGEAMADSALTRRLIAMAASGEPRDTQAAWRPRVVYAARWVAAGLVTSAMAVVGAAAFFVGGEQQDPGPKVTPAMDSFLVQHSIVTGDVPAAPAPAAAAAGPAAAAGSATPTGLAVRAAGPSAAPAGVAHRAAAPGGAAPATARAGHPAATRAALRRPARQGRAGLIAVTASPGP